MREFAFAALLAATTATAAAPSPYTFLLHFPDGSIEVCPATGFVIDYSTVNVAVQDCVPDKVFANGFGG